MKSADRLTRRAGLGGSVTGPEVRYPLVIIVCFTVGPAWEDRSRGPRSDIPWSSSSVLLSGRTGRIGHGARGPISPGHHRLFYCRAGLGGSVTGPEVRYPLVIIVCFTVGPDWEDRSRGPRSDIPWSSSSVLLSGRTGRIGHGARGPISPGHHRLFYCRAGLGGSVTGPEVRYPLVIIVCFTVGPDWEDRSRGPRSDIPWSSSSVLLSGRTGRIGHGARGPISPGHHRLFYCRAGLGGSVTGPEVRYPLVIIVCFTVGPDWEDRSRGPRSDIPWSSSSVLLSGRTGRIGHGARGPISPGHHRLFYCRAGLGGSVTGPEVRYPLVIIVCFTVGPDWEDRSRGPRSDIPWSSSSVLLSGRTGRIGHGARGPISPGHHRLFYCRAGLGGSVTGPEVRYPLVIIVCFTVGPDWEDRSRGPRSDIPWSSSSVLLSGRTGRIGHGARGPISPGHHRLFYCRAGLGGSVTGPEVRYPLVIIVCFTVGPDWEDRSRGPRSDIPWSSSSVLLSGRTGRIGHGARGPISPGHHRLFYCRAGLGGSVTGPEVRYPLVIIVCFTVGPDWEDRSRGPRSDIPWSSSSVLLSGRTMGWGRG
ncbi:hypothetical protein EGW08_001140 [Elysia chlorotica]|uniref:Uncharacterized protein n=1 Tax=Elysia chlorotica TaxID=188477 RepID=A0A3S1I2S0_ELYCH|nr:hypothetical protein EGW08_001140 [Elysia chlorotica]